MFSKIKQLILDQFKVCPKTGKITGLEVVKKKSLWLWIAIGVASVIWVLIRVIPKPSRATYPCQKVAQPIAAGFIAWLVGIIGSTLIMRRARHLFKTQRYWVGAFFFIAAISTYYFTLNSTSDVAASVLDTENTTAGKFVPSDAANTPVGTGKGVNPGRVVWVYSNELCDQGGTSGFWWEDHRTDPDVAQRMMKQAVYNLTGIADLHDAWDAIFKNFNLTHHNETNTGYQAGDKIAIKLNNIFSRSYAWLSSQDNRPNPQMINALITQLVNVAGVPEEDITFYDCIWYHGDPVYNYCHANFPGVRWAEGDGTDRFGYEDGPGNNPGTREKVVRDPDCVVHYSDPEIVKGSGEVCLPTVVSEAKYVMSIGLPRKHELAGYTGCAKNFFGSVWHPTDYNYYHHWSPQCMHEAVCAATDFSGIDMRPMGSYNALVDLMGHEDLGGKTVLCLLECIRYRYWNAAPFNGGPASSLFMSQDFVAIESVMIDFLRSEGELREGTIDNYLHEAAQADNPPSGTVYDPENDGTPLKSLGVHEHWNNSTDKQYTRNLGTGEGIELIQVINDTTTVFGKSTGIDFTNSTNNHNYKLSSNYPNPFKTSTTIGYTLPSSANISLNIYNIKGEKVRTLINQPQSEGSFEVSWDGYNDNNARVSSGVYIYTIEINTGKEIIRQSKQMILAEL